MRGEHIPFHREVIKALGFFNGGDVAGIVGHIGQPLLPIETMRARPNAEEWQASPIVLVVLGVPPGPGKIGHFVMLEPRGFCT